MEKTVKIFKYFSEKGYKHYTENTVEELDKLPLDSPDILTEFAHLCEWLRINHGIWVYPLPIDDDMKLWQCRVIKGEPFTNVKNTLKIITCGEISYRSLHSPQEAYSAAFDYILNNNLI
jgi:hypothetical protein